ncbi:hypothetical protein B4O97_14700 [Marispirochaeta aestuarii]|uniref:Uncharacterized protein n=1 Tax=Marispirochaeta aestuarii TaxID=1963862 RepID=A0A1Y1RVA5_9SPIO|nr:hypothetical protein [Marispirochaeta aestuarii]ORC33907.1 hypothetical protein B4O97_14700 [Marispirochaeta aestuarii]
MKWTAKNRPVLYRLLFLGALTGTLAWALLEMLLSLLGFSFSLEAGPVGFDIHVVSFWVRVNPGTLAGLPAAWLLFKSL